MNGGSEAGNWFARFMGLNLISPVGEHLETAWRMGNGTGRNAQAAGKRAAGSFIRDRLLDWSRRQRAARRGRETGATGRAKESAPARYYGVPRCQTAGCTETVGTEFGDPGEGAMHDDRVFIGACSAASESPIRRRTPRWRAESSFGRESAGSMRRASGVAAAEVAAPRGYRSARSPGEGPDRQASERDCFFWQDAGASPPRRSAMNPSHAEVGPAQGGFAQDVI